MNALSFIVLHVSLASYHLKAAQIPEEGQVRLVGGSTAAEGNIEIFHHGTWGSVCDDEFRFPAAAVVCRQLNYRRGAIRATGDSQFGRKSPQYWLDNVICDGHERFLNECHSHGWGRHDCNVGENAGVVCRPNDVPSYTAQKKLAVQMLFAGKKLNVSLQGGRHEREGRVAFFTGDAVSHRAICGKGWSLREAQVICRQLGHVLAEHAYATQDFGFGYVGLSGVVCTGEESSIDTCLVDMRTKCANNSGFAAVTCTDKLPDLEPDLSLLQSSVYLHDQPLFYLQCAMEEKCVSSSAYAMAQQPGWYYHMRRLLRFTTRVYNFGDAVFRPFAQRESWSWHSCHMHHHSMEVFSHYDIYLPNSLEKVAEGHKASFCLEDSDCADGVSKGYACADFGEQGISVGCWDQYMHDFDCQWIDISDLSPGNYIFKVAINPEYKVAEKNFSNNAIVCDLHYDLTQASVANCKFSLP